MKGERGLTANERDRERGRWREQAVIDLCCCCCTDNMQRRGIREERESARENRRLKREPEGKRSLKTSVGGKISSVKYRERAREREILIVSMMYFILLLCFGNVKSLLLCQ